MLESAFRRAQRGGRQRMPGGGDDRDPEERPAVELCPRVLEAAAAARKRERAPLRNEDLLHLDVLAAGADHAHRVPGVDDPVVALRHRAEAPIDRRLAVDWRLCT